MALTRLKNRGITDDTITEAKWGGGQFGRKNLIINGNFDVWQRGTSSTTSNGYGTADRWKQYTAGVGGATFAQNDDGDMHITVTGSGSGTARVGQIVEFPEWYHGKTVTFSAMVKSNNTNARIIIDSNTQWYTETDTHSGGGDWEQLKITATIESSGLTFLRFTIGLDGVQSANVSLTSSDYVTIKEVQLEVGSSATPFEHRSYDEELARCQRYYQQLDADSSNVFTIPTAFIYGGTNDYYSIYNQILLPVQMRTNPTLTFSASGSSMFAAYGTSAASGTMPWTGSPTTTSNVKDGKSIVFYHELSSNAGGGAGSAVLISIKQNQSIKIDAEL